MSEMRRLSEVNGTTDSTNSSGNATIVVTGDDNSTHIVLVDPVTNATFFLNETFTNITVNGTNMTIVEAESEDDRIIRVAKERSDKLRNTTGGLTSVVGMSLTNGEEPKSVLSPDLSMRVGKKDGCALEDQPFEAPSAGASSGGFQLPQGTTCNRPERRRKLRHLQEATTTTAPAEEAPEIETAFTTFNVNPYSAASEEDIATGVSSIVLKEALKDDEKRTFPSLAQRACKERQRLRTSLHGARKKY